MADPKERSVRFAVSEATEGVSVSDHAVKAVDAQPIPESEPVSGAGVQPASPPTPTVVPSESAPRSILKDRIGVPVAQPEFVHCRECGKDVPIEDWPDHRDRLRNVELVERVSMFQQALVRLLGVFVMWVLKRVYFREVTVVGRENIPQTGAVVFYGNHQNQFIDALMMNSNVGREVRFLMAEKSLHQPVIGTLGRMFNSVAVVRPQDVPLIVGEGKLVKMDGVEVRGEGTRFTSLLTNGDVIVWLNGKTKCTAQVKHTLSDTLLEVTLPVAPENAVNSATDYKFSKRIDHSEMYAQVYDTMAKNHCIGIFPEGGSHDHTSLLPLKAGVALFSLGAAERNISVKIVPVGLTYFYGHKFRSRAYVEFGEPITPPRDLVNLFSTDKREATRLFLGQLNNALHAVTINVSDWKTLTFVHSFRQLYQPPSCTLSARDHLRLTRRLSVIVERERETPKMAQFRAKVENYVDFCNALLVRDSQAATLKNLSTIDSPQVRLLLRRTFTLLMMGVILVPFFVVGTPVGIIIEYIASKRQKKALRESKVKVVGADVKSSWRVLLAFTVLPVVFFIVTFIVFLYTNLHTAIVAWVCLPMSMYVSLLILQEAVMELRAALPLFMSLLSKHKQFKKLYERREELANESKDVVEQFDPDLNTEMAAYLKQEESGDDLDTEPSLFSLRYSVRRRLATNA